MIHRPLLTDEGTLIVFKLFILRSKVQGWSCTSYAFVSHGVSTQLCARIVVGRHL